MSLRKFPAVKFVTDRNRFLVEICKNKNVLHLGCGDAIHFKEHHKIGKHLHLSLLDVSNEIYGVDLNEKIISKLQNEYNVPNLFVSNVENLNINVSIKFDVIIAGELIEHLNNPGLFIDSVKKYMSENSILIITTPNMLSLKLLLHSFKNSQRIHPDHTIGFTFSLLETLFQRYDFEINDWYSFVEIFESNRNSFANNIFSYFFKFFPKYGDSIIAIAKDKKFKKLI